MLVSQVVLDKAVNGHFFHLAGTMSAPLPLPKFTPSQKLRIASRLYATARKVKLAGLRHPHKDWPEERLLRELNLRFFLLHD